MCASKTLTSLLIAFSVTLGCSTNKEDKNSDSDHIQYFGFVLIDTYWDDPTDDVFKTNYIDEVSDFTNIADILVTAPDDDISENIIRMSDHQVKALLHVSEIFFEQAGTSGPSGANYNLRSDFQTRWTEFMTLNNLESIQNLIAALYVGEEPTWNGISFEDLLTATDYIKSTVPEIPIMIVEAHTAIDQLKIPASVDWIGFDHYFIKDPFNDLMFQNELNRLLGKFSNNGQKLVLIMDSHYIGAVHGDYAGIEIDEMNEVAQSYFKVAKSQPKAIAILGYFWPSGFGMPEAVGARNMPDNVKETYIDIGMEIINN